MLAYIDVGALLSSRDPAAEATDDGAPLASGEGDHGGVWTRRPLLTLLCVEEGDLAHALQAALTSGATGDSLAALGRRAPRLAALVRRAAPEVALALAPGGLGAAYRVGVWPLTRAVLFPSAAEPEAAAPPLPTTTSSSGGGGGGGVLLMVHSDAGLPPSELASGATGVVEAVAGVLRRAVRASLAVLRPLALAEASAELVVIAEAPPPVRLVERRPTPRAKRKRKTAKNGDDSDDDMVPDAAAPVLTAALHVAARRAIDGTAFMVENAAPPAVAIEASAEAVRAASSATATAAAAPPPTTPLQPATSVPAAAGAAAGAEAVVRGRILPDYSQAAPPSPTAVVVNGTRAALLVALGAVGGEDGDGDGLNVLRSAALRWSAGTSGLPPPADADVDVIVLHWGPAADRELMVRLRAWGGALPHCENHRAPPIFGLAHVCDGEAADGPAATATLGGLLAAAVEHHALAPRHCVLITGAPPAGARLAAAAATLQFSSVVQFCNDVPAAAEVEAAARRECGARDRLLAEALGSCRSPAAAFALLVPGPRRLLHGVVLLATGFVAGYSRSTRHQRRGFHPTFTGNLMVRAALVREVWRALRARFGDAQVAAGLRPGLRVDDLAAVMLPGGTTFRVTGIVGKRFLTSVVVDAGPLGGAGCRHEPTHRDAAMHEVVAASWCSCALRGVQATGPAALTAAPSAGAAVLAPSRAPTEVAAASPPGRVCRHAFTLLKLFLKEHAVESSPPSQPPSPSKD